MMMKSFRSLHIVIYVTVIGVILSFALCRGDKAELNYYDFAELTIYSTDFDNANEKERYSCIGLDGEKRNEIKTIMEDFDFSRFLDNPYSFGSGTIMKDYYLVITIKNKPYLLEINYRGDIEKNTFNLDEIVSNDKRFFYTNREEIPTATFKNRELSKKMGEFIRKNKSLIDGKMSNIKQEQPKYSSPAIQWIHERYYDAADWVENRYNKYTAP